MPELIATSLPKLNYWIYIVLMMIGFYAMIAKKNLVKKVIGMNVMQTAVILFFISISAKQKATLPILLHSHDLHPGAINALDYINPLPHVLMLTAIVVAVATLGVALALIITIFKQWHTLDEDQIIAQLENEAEAHDA
jgi:multicomponent Na+:H+ antiporter subunit C